MKTFVQHLDGIEGAIMMPRLPGERLCRLLNAAELVKGDASFIAQQKIVAAISELEAFRSDPNSRALPLSRTYVSGVLAEVAGGNCSSQRFQFLVTGISQALLQDLEEGYFAAVAKENLPLLGADWLSNNPISKRSDRILFEIQSAGHCLAFGQPTACVLILTRVMDFGTQLVAKSLDTQSDTLSGKGMGTLATLIHETIRKLVKAGTRSGADEMFYNGLVMDIRAFARGVRNEAVHGLVEYSPSEAMHLLRIVIHFMNFLANNFDDFTKPKRVAGPEGM